MPNICNNVYSFGELSSAVNDNEIKLPHHFTMEKELSSSSLPYSIATKHIVSSNYHSIGNFLQQPPSNALPFSPSLLLPY